MPSNSPIITFTSDFGIADAYVAQVKAVMLRRCPGATVIDITHLIAAQDIAGGSLALERAVASFGAGTVHLAVIDPGVGTSRRILVTNVADQWIVCPDNGLITWTWRRHGGGRCHELTWRPPVEPSEVFHARDIMGPVVGLIAAGDRGVFDPSDIEPILLEMHLSQDPAAGRIIHIDHFGNATTNIPGELLGAGSTVFYRRCAIGPIRSTYAEVAHGDRIALVGSSGLLEIAVNRGSAAVTLGVCVGDRVVVK